MSMLSFKNAGVFTKIMLPMVGGFVLIALFLVIYVLPAVEEQYINNKYKYLEDMTEAAFTALASFDKKADAGEITKDEAKSQALSMLGAMKFDGTNYIFVFNDEEFISHSNKKLIGRKLVEFKDPNGFQFMLDMLKNGREKGSGFTNYHFKKPNSEIIAPKVSYVKRYVPWGWTFGAGVYMDEVEAEVAKLKNTILLAMAGIIAFILIITFVLVKRYIKNPISSLSLMAEAVAKGNLKIGNTIDTKDELGLLATSFDTVVRNLRLMSGEMSHLTSAAENGNLSLRGKTDGLEGAYSEIVAGVNSTLDSLINPLNLSSEYMTAISEGNLPETITSEYKGDYNKIKNSINQCINAINGLIEDANDLANAADNGDLRFRAAEGKHSGDFKRVIIGMNSTFDNLSKPINLMADYISKINSGAELEEITYSMKGDYDTIVKNINSLRLTLNNIVGQIEFLIEGTKRGELSLRAEYKGFSGRWLNIVTGMNDMLDGIINPINEVNSVLAAIAGGSLQIKVESDMKGDLKTMKDSVNNVYFWLLGLIDYVTKIADGDMSAQIAKASDKDEIHKWLLLLKNNINALAGDVNTMSSAALSGNLKMRSDVTKHKGEYSKIVTGFNETIDAVLLPINESIEVLSNMANGDLSLYVNGEYNGDHALLKESINTTLDSLNKLLSQVALTVQEVARGAVQVSDASTALSQGATEQAASLEEITSSMSEIGSQTRENAEYANNANSLTYETQASAGKGEVEMNKLSSAMSEINETSKSISKIIKVIDEIAFQTNLLALNAAVEAARAGRHGKGFAVVAEEVRNLAARSAEAAKETSDLIEASIKSVENGMMLVGRTSDVLVEIKHGSEKSTAAVQKIAELSNGQAMAIAQINEGLVQIDKVTQTNTASSEESASASEELSGQAAQLSQMLANFKLKQDSNAHYSMNNDDDDFNLSGVEYRKRLLN